MQSYSSVEAAQAAFDVAMKNGLVEEVGEDDDSSQGASEDASEDPSEAGDTRDPFDIAVAEGVIKKYVFVLPHRLPLSLTTTMQDNTTLLTR